MTDKSFHEQCYEILKRVPKGRVTTYGAIASALNSKAWRAVGSAMARNKNPIIIPCHRVVKSDGRIGRYAFGVEKKVALLKEEGVTVTNGRVDDFSQILFRF